jgi:hypothetical protein
MRAEFLQGTLVSFRSGPVSLGWASSSLSFFAESANEYIACLATLSRGDKTAIELFLVAVRLFWDSKLVQSLYSASGVGDVPFGFPLAA